MNVIAGSDNKVIFEASLRIEIIACEAEVGFRGRLQEIDQEINPDVGLVEDVAVKEDCITKNVPIEAILLNGMSKVPLASIQKVNDIMSKVVQKHGWENVLQEVVSEGNRRSHDRHVHQSGVVETCLNTERCPNRKNVSADDAID